MSRGQHATTLLGATYPACAAPLPALLPSYAKTISSKKPPPVVEAPEHDIIAAKGRQDRAERRQPRRAGGGPRTGPLRRRQRGLQVGSARDLGASSPSRLTALRVATPAAAAGPARATIAAAVLGAAPAAAAAAAAPGPERFGRLLRPRRGARPAAARRSNKCRTRCRAAERILRVGGGTQVLLQLSGKPGVAIGQELSKSQSRSKTNKQTNNSPPAGLSSEVRSTQDGR